VEGDTVAQAGLDVAVDAIHGHVELAAQEPLREGEVPLEHLAPGLGPLEASGLRLPEGERVGRRLVVDVGVRIGILGQCRRRRERPRLVQQRGQSLLLTLAHVVSSSGVERSFPCLAEGDAPGHGFVPRRSRSSNPSKVKAGVTVAPTRA